MTDRPILFSAPMVKALIREANAPGTGKTQTRRLLKIPAHLDSSKGYVDSGLGWGQYLKAPCFAFNDFREGEIVERVRPPYEIDDRLWVKETFLPDPPADHDSWDEEGIETYVSWSGTDGPLSNIPKALRKPEHVLYRATWKTQHEWRWRPSLFMPRWASRLTLTVTDVRVQRLQEISEEDALAEGVTDFAESCDRPRAWEGLKHEDRIGMTRVTFGSAKKAYNALWDSLNPKIGKRWDDNPWIVACTFRVELRNIDRVPAESAEAATA